jgi:hypothetical protein
VEWRKHTTFFNVGKQPARMMKNHYHRFNRIQYCTLWMERLRESW